MCLTVTPTNANQGYLACQSCDYGANVVIYGHPTYCK